MLSSRVFLFPPGTRVRSVSTARMNCARMLDAFTDCLRIEIRSSVWNGKSILVFATTDYFRRSCKVHKAPGSNERKVSCVIEFAKAKGSSRVSEVRFFISQVNMCITACICYRVADVPRVERTSDQWVEHSPERVKDSQVTRKLACAGDEFVAVTRFP